MGGAFPELKRNPGRVADIVKDEEVSFGRTLDRGIELFEEAATRSANLAGEPKHYRLKAEPGHYVVTGGTATFTISGQDAFKLHDTYGFPIDLTRIMAEERGMRVDLEGYDKLMERAREVARTGGKIGDTRLFELPPDALAALHRSGARPTDDSAKFNAAPIGATVKGIWDGSKLVHETHGSEAAGQGVAVILDRTNFYAEMGGQVGDTGELRSRGGAVMAVETARVAGGYVLHVGNMVEGHLSVGDH